MGIPDNVGRLVYIILITNSIIAGKISIFDSFMSIMFFIVQDGLQDVIGWKRQF